MHRYNVSRRQVRTLYGIQRCVHCRLRLIYALLASGAARLAISAPYSRAQDVHPSAGTNLSTPGGMNGLVSPTPGQL